MTDSASLHSRCRSALLCLLLASSVAMAQSHRLNLQDASIQTMVATVGEITGFNFVLDPRVEGTVNVISNKDMTEEQIYDLFVSVLRVHGYGVVHSGDFIKIVPDSVAAQDAIPSLSRERLSDDQLVTQVIELKHIKAADVVSLLRPLVPQNGQIQAHEDSNTLLVSDRVANVRRIRQIIQRIDTASSNEIEVIALQHASASEVVRMVNLLNQDAGSNGAPKAIADERTNSILVSGDPGGRLRLKTMVTHLDTPLEGSENTQVINLQFASADSLVGILESVSKTLAGTGSETDAPATIHAHPETNALVITASPAVYRKLAGIVRQLDVRRRQVIVEAIIAEVSDDLTKELGVQWQATGLDSLSDSGLIGGTNFPRSGSGGIFNVLGSTDNGLSLGSLGSGLNLGYLAGTIAVPTGQIGADGNPITAMIPQLGALASALNSDAGSNVLSTPSIVTLDHHEAVINVGQEVPFVTGQFTNTGANNSSVNPFQTIQREDVGLTLTVTPHLNDSDTITLELAQEVSSLAAQSAAVDLITNKREISTTVMVEDGGILILGGLIDETIQENIQKVPGLGDIPVVGNLFKFRKTNKVKRNLMVFIRPRILRDVATENAITSDRYNYMRDEQLRARERYDGLLNSEQLPLLPTLDDYQRAHESADDQ